MPALDQHAAHAEEVLVAFNARTRQRRKRYTLTVGVIVLIALGGLIVAVARGGASHASLKQAAAAPIPLPAATVSDQLQIAWTSADTTAVGAPFYGGTVVTYSAHAVNGRDARTGAIRWSLTRSDRRVCAAAQENGHTFALFADGADCDELSLLSTDTGARIQERTLFDDGHLVTGTPGVLANSDSLLLYTGRLVRTIRFTDGLNGWTYAAPNDCSNLRVVRGDDGVLISQHCADAEYLLLRDAFQSDSTDASTSPVHWRIKTNGVVPLNADGFIGGLSPTDHTVIRYDVASGAERGRTTLQPQPSALLAVSTTAGASGALIRIGQISYSLDVAGDEQLWSRTLSGPPTFSGPRTVSGESDSTTLAAIASNALAVLNPDDGATVKSYAIATPPSDAVVIRAGSGFVVAGASTTVYQ